MSNLVLRPPEFAAIDDLAMLDKLIFLGGPIQGAPDWQQEAIERFDSTSEDLAIASPRKDYAPDEFVYEKQVDWETYQLRRAGRLGAVMFWLARQTESTPGRAYAQTSRFELGEMKIRHETKAERLVVGIEEGFGNERYIRHRLGQDCPHVPIFNNLSDTCETTLKLLERRRLKPSM